MHSIILSMLLFAAAQGDPVPGALVEQAAPGGAAAQVGLLPGDLLLSWRRATPEPASGPIGSPFDLVGIEIAQAPLGKITLHGRRVDETLTVTLPPGEWKLEAAANRSAAAASADPATEAWLRFETARGMARAGRWDDARALVEEAARTIATSGDPSLRALLWHVWGVLCSSNSRFEQAEAAHRNALAAGRAASSRSLLVAESLFQLGSVALKQGDLAAAEEHLLAALELRRELAPASAAHARTLNTLGVTYRRRGGPGDYDRAERQHRQALAIMREVAPAGYDTAYSFMALGNVAWMRGDLSAASEFYDQALPIFDETAPGTLGHAAILINLGNVMTNRGNLARAEKLYEQATEIRQHLAPDSLEVAQSYASMGAVSLDRGDLEAARDQYLRALAITERLAPGSEETATILINLAATEIEMGDLPHAEAYYTRALELAEARSPENVDVASALQNLGDLAALRKDYDKAERSLLRALKIWRRLAPDGMLLGWTLHSLGEVARERGQLGLALKYNREALDIRTSRAPGSRFEATSAAAVARVLRLQGKPGESLAMYRRAITALETQQGRLGGVEPVRTAFRSKYMSIYRDTIDLLVDRGRDVEAFDLLERSRARGLLALLAERDLVFSADIPEEMDRRRRVTAEEYDRVQESLQAASTPGSGQEVQEMRERLRALRREHEEIREEIRQASPRLAALQQPEALGFAAATRSLDPGSAVLSYSVGRDRTRLFAVDAGGDLSVVTLPFGEEDLSQRIRAFRQAIGAAGREGDADEARRSGEALYDALVAPAETVLAGAERVLILPDGPLHLVPFAALRRPAGEDRRGEYLVEWKPLHLAASMTVHHELKSARHAGRPGTVALLAFGDPLYAARNLPPLPASREEVQAITGRFGASARLLVREQATETRAREVGRDVRMIHFAAHALVDERHPLDSGIALSAPPTVLYGQDNGLLQAWEILESMRIDADLVTLSGCETALGRELAGEGIIGLTRAFQYAGARTVAASLWSVPDRSTAILMGGFYGYLKRGLAKDEALRAAQIDLIRGTDSGAPGPGDEMRGMKRLAKSGDPPTSYASPFHWAAFQLYGDWK